MNGKPLTDRQDTKPIHGTQPTARIKTAAHRIVRLVRRSYSSTTGNRIQDSIPGNRVTNYTQDLYGRDSVVTVPLRTAVRTIYDILNRPTKSIVGSDTVQYFYDDSLHLTRVLDAKVVSGTHQTYTYAYGPSGLLQSTTAPGGRTTTYKYDIESQLVALINRRGDTLRVAYDSLHRETSKWARRGSATLDSTYMRYGNNGRIIGSISPAVQESVFVNMRSQVDSTYTWHNSSSWRYPMWYKYNATTSALDTLSASGVSAPFKKHHFGFAAARGTLDTLGLNTTNTFFSRNADLNVTAINFSGGYSDTRGWTSIHTPTGYSVGGTVDNSYTGAVRRELAYDTTGNLVRELNWWREGRRFSFDGLGRLATDTFEYVSSGCYYTGGDGYPPCGPDRTDSVHTFTYDPAHNRTDQSATYNSGNRITHFGSCDYVTDDDGNVIRRICGSTEKDTLWWSVDNRLDSVKVYRSSSDTARLRFWYDRAGRLIKRDANGTVRFFLWDGDNLFAELYGPDGEYAAEYSYYGTDHLHALIVGGTPYYAHADGPGNVIALTEDQYGSADRDYVYDEWGRLIGGSDNASFNDRDRVRWKGALMMAPEVGFGGFYYMRQRWYEPYTGRFLSEDPIGVAGGINQYIFGGNDPVNTSDPSGLLVQYHSCRIDHYCPEPDDVFDDCWPCSGGGGGYHPLDGAVLVYDRWRDGPLADAPQLAFAGPFSGAPYASIWGWEPNLMKDWDDAAIPIKPAPDAQIRNGWKHLRGYARNGVSLGGFGTLYNFIGEFGAPPVDVFGTIHHIGLGVYWAALWKGWPSQVRDTHDLARAR